jgi:hypothetical protein
MHSRLTLIISDAEREALQTMGQRELRSVRDQALYLLREALKQRGFLCDGDQISGSQTDPGADNGRA